MPRRRQLAILAWGSCALAVGALAEIVVVADRSAVPGIVAVAVAAVTGIGCVCALSPRSTRTLVPLVIATLIGTASLTTKAVRLHDARAAERSAPILRPAAPPTPEHAVGCVDALTTGAADPDTVIGSDFVCHRRDGATVVVAFFANSESGRRWAARAGGTGVVLSADGTVGARCGDPDFADAVRAAGGLPD